MRWLRFSFLLLALVVTAPVWAYGIGSSSLPLPEKSKVITTEASSIFTRGGGSGLQVRYAQKINQMVMLDGGVGVSGGDFANRIFLGADYEIFPDYERQPRVLLRGAYENAKEQDFRRHIWSLAPVVSKGTSFWGHEAFPYIALPLGLALQSKTGTYRTTIQTNLGLNMPLQFEGIKNLILHSELSFNIKDSFTGILLGLSYPLND